MKRNREYIDTLFSIYFISLSLRKEPKYQRMPQIAAFFICKGLKKVYFRKAFANKKMWVETHFRMFRLLQGYCRQAREKRAVRDLSNQWCPPSTESIDCKVCHHLLADLIYFRLSTASVTAHTRQLNNRQDSIQRKYVMAACFFISPVWVFRKPSTIHTNLLTSDAHMNIIYRE